MQVSVIMPVYNVEEYIREAIDSFISQSLKDIEIICVDDGSTDSSRSIVEEYMKKDRRVNLLSQENRGAGAARNLGMKEATGKYIYFFDSDDYCEHFMLEKLVEKAEETLADIVVFDYFRIDEQTKEVKEYKGLDNRIYPEEKDTFSYEDVPYKILSMVNPTPWNKLYNREFVLDTGLEYMTLSTTNDITFAALTVAMAKRIAYVKEPLMYYRINRKEALTSFKQKRMQNVLKAVEMVVVKSHELPYADIIDSSIMYFTMDNLIFALEHYAGSFTSKYYRNYYKEIYNIFNSDIFKNASNDTIVNKNLYAKYLDIKYNSYERRFLIKVKSKIKDKLKIVLFPILGVSVKRFEDRLGTQKKEIEYLKNRLHEAKRREDTILNRSRENERKINLLISKVNAMETIICMQSDAINREVRDEKIIVSMTSFPARIRFVPVTLERLMNQTVKPDRIILWLSEDNFPNKENDLPYRLLQMRSRGLEIKWCKGDDKSYKKLLPALLDFPKDLLITVDDDLVYDVDLIENLYEGHRMFPDAIIASRVHKIVFDSEGNIAPYKEWEKEINFDIYEPRTDLFATTGAGTLFPPNSLNEEVFNLDSIRELCPHADDIWTKVMSVMNGTKIVHTGKNRRLRYVEGTQDERLWDLNEEGNDVQLKSILLKYKLKAKEFLE